MAKPTTTESQHQIALFELLKWVAIRDPRADLAFHVPNGGDRHAATAARLKLEGVKPGVPDVILPVAAHGHHGLALELKREDGEVSREQQRWIAALEGEGWRCVVARGWEQAAREILAYLDHPAEDYGL